MDQQAKERVISSIVAAYAARPEVGPDDIVELVRKLLPEFEGAAAPAQTAVARIATATSPALPVEQAVTPDMVYCLCCGKGFKMLKRHIGAEHGLTEGQYRRMFGLSEDFPLVAPSYSERKAKRAKQQSLGKYSRDRSSNASPATS
jgi:predicted transcriptional regulator